MRAFTPKGWTRPILTSDNPNLKQWRHLVACSAHDALVGHGDAFAIFEGPVILEASFYLPVPKSLPKRVTRHTKKPDCSKLLRALEDALTGVVYKDDSQIDVVRIEKVYAVNQAVGVHVVIEG